MKPLELSSVNEIWKSALSILGKHLASHGHDPQIWFPWGQIWRGHDQNGQLPPTNLPDSLRTARGERFGGRTWWSVDLGGFPWLISLKKDGPPMSVNMPPFTDEVMSTMRLLGDFVRLEGLLGLSFKILENRAGEHLGHWERVRHLASAIGRHLNLPGRDLMEVELAALLHDIGKVALPSSILEVSRSLSPAERKQVETHSVVGAGMIREIPGMERVAETVLYHHEAPDGSGYPKGLAGADIPLPSLIVGAADAFDAMTHFRPYADEKTYKESLEEMMRHTGKFDDRVLWALQEVLRKLGILDTRPAHLEPEPRP